MSLFKQIQSRQVQRKANNFIKSLSKKSTKEVEQMYLDNKEFENNEIVLSYLFFKQPSLIRILPLDFQISRLNSNLNMFKHGSSEAKKELILLWFKDNKFFTNSNALNLSDEEYKYYISLYFKQPLDVAKLHMVDLRTVIDILSKIDIKETELLIEQIKDDFTDRQWEFVIEACPMLIKYASQEIQNKYAEDDKYNKFINGKARELFVKKQIDLLKDDISLINTLSIDVQSEFISKYPYMINLLDSDLVVKLLQYNIDLIKNINISSFKNSSDHGLDIIYGVLSNIESKSVKETINIFVNKGLLNAKGKLYRFDKNSNDCSYQYTPKIIEIIQKLTISQIISLIMIDVNYAVAYIVPLFNSNDSREVKERIIIDANYRCLNVFREYYGNEIYDNYYKVINKIYNDYLENYDKYEFSNDYNSIFDLFKVLFNKSIITKNNQDKITVFIGMSLLYKSANKHIENSPTIKLLNDMLSVAYDRVIHNDNEIYNINSLELFDSKFDFISEKLRNEYNKFNFLNVSSLLFIVKSNKVSDLFKKYYEIIINIYGENKESIFKACENFHYYIDILRSVDSVELNEIEEENLISLLSTYANNCNITTKDELANYDLTLLKKLVSDLSVVKDDNVYKNLLCNYLFNKGYDKKGNIGLLESDTIKELCDMYDEDLLVDLEIDSKKIFSIEEVNLFKMIKLMFSVNDSDLLFTYLDDIISFKVKRNIISVINLFNKLKKYRLEIINNQIVTLDDIEYLCENNPSVVSKSVEGDVDVYTINGQDFKVLYSSNNDGINYMCADVSSLDKNFYGYNRLVNSSSIRFNIKDGVTNIKFNKDNFIKEKNNPDFILVPNAINPDLLKIAKDNKLKIILIKGELTW